MLWIKFLIGAGVILIAGVKITRYSDAIAARTGISRGFIGILLLAAITSLPELAVTLSAVKINNSALAIADLLGSNLFNIVIIAVVAIFLKQGQFVLRLNKNHILPAGAGVLLMAIAAGTILVYDFSGRAMTNTPVFLGLGSALILLIYLSGMYFVFKREKEGFQRDTPEVRKLEAASLYIRFIFAAAVIVASGVFIARLADEISRTPFFGVVLGSTFMGTLFLAVATSLPELVVSMQAARMGLFDMAAGNIFGSNMFNMAIIPVVDVFFGKKAVLSSVPLINTLTAAFAVLLSGLIVWQLRHRVKREFLRLNWDIWAIGIIYLFGTIIVFYLR